MGIGIVDRNVSEKVEDASKQRWGAKASAERENQC